MQEIGGRDLGRKVEDRAVDVPGREQPEQKSPVNMAPSRKTSLIERERSVSKRVEPGGIRTPLASAADLVEPDRGEGADQREAREQRGTAGKDVVAR